MKIKYLLLISIVILQQHVKAFNLKKSAKDKTFDLAVKTFCKMIEDLTKALNSAKINYFPFDNLKSFNIDRQINGESLLITAVRENKDLNLIKLLLECGADPEYIYIPKKIAVDFNVYDVMCATDPNRMIENSMKEFLFFENRRINPKNALYYAKQAKDPNVLKLLIEYMTPQAQIISAAKRGDLEKIESLLNNSHINININDLVDANGKTPLIWAVIFNKSDIVKFFLYNGADYTIRDKSDNSFEDYIIGEGVLEDIFIKFKERREEALKQALPVAMPNELQKIVLQFI